MEENGLDLSIVLCTRNRAQALKKTLTFYDKIQTDLKWELVLVDNGSSDETASVIQEAIRSLPCITYFREDRTGLGAARARGWKEARGDIIVFTDDDCYPDPGLVETYVRLFATFEDVAYMGGRILLWNPEALRAAVDYRDTPETIEPFQFMPAGVLHGANMAFRKSALQAIGGFDPELGAGTPFPCEDIDVLAAAAWKGLKGRFDPSPVIYHDHGRTEGHREAISKGYALGRGAYYMKYILRPDTRKTYLSAWAKSLRWNIRLCLTQFSLAPLSKTGLEIKGALRYLFRHRG